MNDDWPTYHRMSVRAHEFVHGDHHVEDFGLGNVTVAVEIVEGESPFQFLLRRASEERGERDQHVLS